ncbi:MAG: PIN domain-containing protein [Geodermatophilaceae bacterium]|nr:PIN domain-containing protein [Geodermatophilaceae bacterium]
MIVVDTSVWIELFRATGSSAHLTLRSLLAQRAELATTEIVVMEILAGVRSAPERRAVRAQLLGLPVLALRGVLDYERAAELYCRLRGRGVTPRQLTDLLIVVCTMDAGAALLHADRDFDRLATETGLAIHPHIPPHGACG